MTTIASPLETLSALVEDGTEAVDHIEVIETVIASLDQSNSAMVSHQDSAYLWKFTYGSVEVFVQLSGTNDEDILTVWSPVLTLPAKDEPKLMRHLLEMNCGETFEASFGILGNQVVVLASRPLADMSAGETSRIMTIVATIADDNDETLQGEYALA